MIHAIEFALGAVSNTASAPAHVGTFSGPFLALGCVLRPRHDGRHPEQRSRHHCRRLLRLGPGHSGRAHDHGVTERLPARAAPALGRVPEQVIQGDRLAVRAFLLCRHAGRGGGGPLDWNAQCSLSQAPLISIRFPCFNQ